MVTVGAGRFHRQCLFSGCRALCLTGLHYRKGVLPGFFLDPRLARGEPRDQYKGETHLLLFQIFTGTFCMSRLWFIVILDTDAIDPYLADRERWHTFGVSVARWC